VSDLPATIQRMKPTEFWFWMMKSDTTGKVQRTPCRFTEDDALGREPKAVRVPGTCEVRNLPTTPEEYRAMLPSSIFQNC